MCDIGAFFIEPPCLKEKLISSRAFVFAKARNEKNGIVLIPFFIILFPSAFFNLKQKAIRFFRKDFDKLEKLRRNDVFDAAGVIFRLFSVRTDFIKFSFFP